MFDIEKSCDIFRGDALSIGFFIVGVGFLGFFLGYCALREVVLR